MSTLANLILMLTYNNYDKWIDDMYKFLTFVTLDNKWSWQMDPMANIMWLH